MENLKRSKMKLIKCIMPLLLNHIRDLLDREAAAVNTSV